MRQIVWISPVLQLTAFWIIYGKAIQNKLSFLSQDFYQKEERARQKKKHTMRKHTNIFKKEMH